jgi:glycosyltransferase 2 family protein
MRWNGKSWGRVAAVMAILSAAACLLPITLQCLGEAGSRGREFRWVPLILALVLSVALRPVNALGWHLVLAAIGYRLLSRAAAIRIWIVAEVCRWLPGGAWHFGSRTIQSTARGMPPLIAVASMGLEMLLMIVASLALGLAGLFVYKSQWARAGELLWGQTVVWGARVSLAFVALAALAAVVVLPMRRVFPEKYRAWRERLQSLRHIRLQAWPMSACLMFYTGLMMLNGVAFYGVAASVTSGPEVPLFAAMAVNALAWFAGLIVVTAPAGLGVREGVLVLVMSAWIGAGDAVLVALLWRGLLLASELVCVLAVCTLPWLAAAIAYCRQPRNEKAYLIKEGGQGK